MTLPLNNNTCQACELCQSRTRVLNGNIKPGAPILLIDDYPSIEDDSRGAHHQSAAGDQLLQVLRAAGISTTEISYTTAVRCCPKFFDHVTQKISTQKPKLEQILACFPFLEAEINYAKPQVIVPMGATALQALLKKKQVNIMDYRGVETLLPEYNCKMLPTVSPRSLLLNPKLLHTTVADFTRIKASAKQATLLTREEGTYITAQTLEDIDEIIEKASNAEAVAFDIETSGLQPLTDKILCIALTWREGTGVVIPLTRFTGYEEEYTVPKQRKLTRRKKGCPGERETIIREHLAVKTRMVNTYEDYWGSNQQYVLDKLKQFFSTSVMKLAHNGKFDCLFLERIGIHVDNFNFDTMLAHYLLDENAQGLHGLKALAWAYTNMGGYDDPLEQWFEERKITDDKRCYAHLPADMLYKYAAMDTDCCFRLWQIFYPQLEQQELINFFDRLIMPLSETLLQAEKAGMLIDQKYLQELKQSLTDDSALLTEQLKKLVGDVNIASPKQLAELLFTRLKLPVIKKTAKGTLSTDEDVLEALAEKHEVPKLILQFRKNEKTLNTYALGLEERLGADGRIHASFIIPGTVTGRLSSQNPNLQNIPKKDKRIKRLFVSCPGWSLLEADYAQAEFRMFAHYSGDETMIADIIAATNGTGPDIHRLMAATCRRIPLEQVTDEMRTQAKGVTFGLMYGRSARSVAAEYGIPEEEAEEIVRTFGRRYPRAMAWLEATVDTVRRYKQVRNAFGRLRRLPGINHLDEKLRAQAERQAVNSPIQGAASDLNCNAANRIRLQFQQLGLKTGLRALIHDALLYEIPDEERAAALNIIHAEMERPVEGMIVPLQAEFKGGKCWGAVELIIKRGNNWYIQSSTEVLENGQKVIQKTETLYA